MVNKLTRAQIADKYKWNLQDLFENNEAWQAKKAELKVKVDKFESFKGHLGESADILFECLEFASDIGREFFRLNAYANQLLDLDVRESLPLSMKQEIDQLGTKISALESFIDPEILALDEELVQTFLTEKSELKVYSHYLDNIHRLKSHTRNENEEEIISQAGMMSDTPAEIYSVFKDADMPRASLTLADGQEVRLDDAAYTLYRANPDREVRKKVAEEFFGTYKQYERSFGVQLYNQVKTHLFYKNVRHYSSCLEKALDGNNIPTAVYKNLIASVHENLPTLERYLKLKKQMLGLIELHYYDVYPPIVKEVNLTYSVEEAEALVKKSLQPLGDDYVSVVNEAFNNRWIDMYSSQGKTSGAYSSGSSYDVHPYILMNYMGKYDDVSTLAHELGHTMHSYYSNKTQTFFNSHYPIFLAEVASTTNEALLVDETLKSITDKQQRLAILGNQLEMYRGTLFRQTQFAEFELKIHELAESGKSLTGEELSKIYLDILKTYYGHDKGVMVVDDLYGIEWAYIPHFYYNFYVFQYATSLCATTAIAEQIIKNENDMRQKFVTEFLSAGCSDYAIPILKRLGVDMTTTEAFQPAFKKMNQIMDEMERILIDSK